MSHEYKTSFMLEQPLVDKLISYLKNKHELAEKTSKYQLARVIQGNHQLLIYRSGIVIFEEDPQLRGTIKQFLEENHINQPEMESYQSNDEEEDKRGWEDTPKGVFLTPDQITDLESRIIAERIPGEKHEYCRYTKGDQILVINNNGVVYTVGGFEGIGDLLRQTINAVNPYGDFHRVIIIDEKGKWDRIGPVSFVVVDLPTSDLLELQLMGIKDDSKSRSIDHIENMNLIEPRVSYHQLVLDPEEINSSIETRVSYREWISSKFDQFFHNLTLDINDNTLVICIEDLAEAVEATHLSTIKHNNREHPALGVSSTITNAIIQKWADDWYKFIGFEPLKHNIELIRTHDQQHKLAKSFLL